MLKEKEKENENNINNEDENLLMDNQFNDVAAFIDSESSRKKVYETGFYDTKYYEKLELIDVILNFIKNNLRGHSPPNEKVVIDMRVLRQLKELIEVLFAYFNVLPPMQKKCLDKNLNDLINNNILTKMEMNKKIYFIERDIKKAKYNLISKKDLYELLKKRGLA